MNNQTPQSTFDEKLDQILKQFTARFITNPNIDVVHETKAAITSLVLEVIGENQKPMRGYNFARSEKFLKNAAIRIENELRAQQRSIITKESTPHEN